ncbi:MAG: hypothetical protein COB59_03320 [Rhodospirillaceae bacterium]|nr:MAG: hypothetical protein COB59_03320 [Rhodospirillaceae bacterium]
MVVKIFSFVFLIALMIFRVNFVQAVEIENGLNKSIHDDYWWRPAYDKAVNQEDCSKAVLVLNRAVKAGNINAHGSLAAFNIDGTCMNKNFINAMSLFRYGAERGHTSAAIFMAQAYFLEKGADDPSAKKWAHRAQFAMMSLEPMYWEKIIPSLLIKDPLSPHLKKAFSWYEKTLQENSTVLFKIGQDFLHNGTWPESKVLACYWLMEAARKGHIRANFLAAHQLIMGDGVLVSPRSGTVRLQEAVEGNDIDALLFAAQILEQGHVANLSYETAYFALLRAESLGAQVSKSLDRIAPYLSDLRLREVMHRAQDTTYFPTIWTPIGQIEPSSCEYASR